MYKSEFNQNQIMNDISQIQEELLQEQSKPNEERDKQKELKLIYKQFIKGLKLSTGNKLF